MPEADIGASRHVLPFVDWLSRDSCTVRHGVCDEDPEILRYFEESGRKTPSSTALFYYVSQKEDEVLTIAREERGPTTAT